LIINRKVILRTYCEERQTGTGFGFVEDGVAGHANAKPVVRQGRKTTGFNGNNRVARGSTGGPVFGSDIRS
jgi:hypothetical protein